MGIGLAAGVDQASGAAAAIGGLAGRLVTALIETVLSRPLPLMLRPGDPGFLHLRLGRDEGRLFLVGLIFVCGVVLFTGLAIGPGALGRTVRARARHYGRLAGRDRWGMAGASVRPGGPISFAERRIDFPRSWRLTNGQGWPLLGMWFLNFCLVMFVWLAL